MTTDADFLLLVLEDGEPHSQADLLRRSFQERGFGLTVHSRIADLRSRGYLITCERVPGKTRGEAWAYQLLASPQSVPAPDPPLPPSGWGDAKQLALEGLHRREGEAA